MNMLNPIIPVLAALIFALVIMVTIVVLLSRYTKVGLNQVLIISGRKVRRLDGSVVGYRIVKGGGTFVIPVIEKVDVLSLAVMSIPKVSAQALVAGGRKVSVEGSAQVKISGDDDGIAAAAEHFVGSQATEIPDTVRPILEMHLADVLAGSAPEEMIQNPVAGAAKVKASAESELRKMGLEIISFTLRDVREV
jgi:flotillin